MIIPYFCFDIMSCGPLKETSGKMKNSKTALLIIDMQKGSFTDKTPRFDTNGVIKRINELMSIFRKQKLPVISFNTMERELGNLKRITPNGKISTN